ncbi:MAG: protein-L-isoaspartate(D-aspartate) O-methyltransferase [Paludibacter sp.]
MKEIEYGRLRQVMVEQQIKRRGICNPNVLDAFLNVRRHIFLPAELRDRAYEDHPLPIGFNQTISQPYIVAYMINALEPDKNMRVLEIGTGSGYQTAVISLLFKEIFSLEINAKLAHRAQKILNEEGYRNIKIKTGDGFEGWKEFAPFDRIIVSCAPANIPAALSEQLAEGGKMIIPAGEKYDQKLYLVEKKDGIISQAERLHVAFVPMLHKE